MSLEFFISDYPPAISPAGLVRSFLQRAIGIAP
jgi:hypothetical protein